MDQRVEWLIDAIAQRDPERVALIHGPRRWTYGQLREESLRRAGVLVEAGLRPGDRVITALPVTDDLMIAFLACCRAGGIFTTLSPLLNATELRDLSTWASPAFALTDDGQPWTALLASRTLPLALPGQPQPTAREEVMRRSAMGDATASAAIRATSSATGTRPKLVVRTHAQLTWRRPALARWDTPASINSCYLPNQFMSGEASRVFALGAILHLPASATPRGVEREFLRHRVTVVYTAPALLGQLVGQPTPPPAGLSLAFMRITAAALPPALQEEAARRYGVPITTEYGLTEGGAIMGSITEETPIGSIGRPFSGTEVRLLGEGGEAVSEGEIGELVFRSPNVMLGYHDDAEATAAILRDGWLHTGDLARRDEVGFYYLVGRRNLRINVGGFKFAPEEFEAVLLQHSGVREAVVVARPDAARGEVACAIIVSVGDPPPDDEELRSFCRTHLAGYKVPRRFEFRDTLPRSALGKVLRRQL